MTAPMTPDEARLRELAEALKFFGRYATETEDDARIRRNTNLIHASQAVLALLAALSAERERGDRAVGLLRNVLESRESEGTVGFGEEVAAMEFLAGQPTS